MSQEKPILKKGVFYTIYDDGDHIILEDKTKRGLAIQECSLDASLGVDAQKGTIHDMDGIGHTVPVRWMFQKADYDLPRVLTFAKDLEDKYTKLRELTCPD